MIKQVRCDIEFVPLPSEWRHRMSIDERQVAHVVSASRQDLAQNPVLKEVPNVAAVLRYLSLVSSLLEESFCEYSSTMVGLYDTGDRAV